MDKGTEKKEWYRKKLVWLLAGVLAAVIVFVVVSDGAQARRCSGYRCILSKTAENR